MDGHDKKSLNRGWTSRVRETDGRGGGMEEWRKGEKAEAENEPKDEGWEPRQLFLGSWQSLRGYGIATRACLILMIHVVSVVKESAKKNIVLI